MIKRTLFFENPCSLSLKNKQLVIVNKSSGEIRTVPIEDIGIMIIENQQVNITIPVINELSENNVCVIICNNKHMPSSLILSMEGNNLQSEIFNCQIERNNTIKGKLWQQIIKAKIMNQSQLLKRFDLDYSPILEFVECVKEGDKDNREAISSRMYWQRLFGKGFIRDRYGDYPNNLLNYGYIILRSAVARALVGSGLNPLLGVHHHNKYNPFCLVDDVMEPYRQYVDLLVYDIVKRNNKEALLETKIKLELLSMLTMDTVIKKKRSPLMVALSSSTASLCKCYKGESDIVLYPILESYVPT